MDDARPQTREMIVALLTDAYARADEAHSLATEVGDSRAGRIQDARGRLLVAREAFLHGHRPIEIRRSEDGHGEVRGG